MKTTQERTTQDTSALVLPFSDLSRGSLAMAGGKAANLGELERAGFPVPSGFCVTTRAYALVAAESAAGPILGELAATDAADAERLRGLAARAREAILTAPVPESVTRACAEAYRALGPDVAVAVRSSATAEDLPDASFAGQQDTYLNVVGEAAVLDAIRRCWASLWTDRATAYRATHRIDPRNVELAVAVQRMVRAKVAGVLFTANPITGRRRHAVIDASPGLGEAVVSGAVNPDHFEVSLEHGRVLSRRLGDKRIAIEATEGGGTRHVERKDASAEACISDEEAIEIARLGARVEAHYGAPQDIEWALDEEGALRLLQARPITTLYPLPEGARATAEELQVYLNFNVAQGVFRPLTPMGIDCWRAFLTGAARHLGYGPEIVNARIKTAGHRIFIDITPLVRSSIGRRFITFAFTRMEARSAAMLENLFKEPRLSVLPFSRARIAGHVLRGLGRLNIPSAAARALVNPAAARARAQTWDRMVEIGRVAPGAPDEAKLDAIEAMLRAAVREIAAANIPLIAVGMLSFLLAKRLLQGLSTDRENEAVMRALPHNPTTEMDLELWHIAESVRDDEAIRILFRETPPATLAEQARRSALPGRLQEKLDTFLRHYGARGVAEIDTGVARWREDPTHILGSVANYLALDEGAVTPAEQFRRAEAEAEAIVAELTQRARGAGVLRGAVVGFALSRTRALAGLREAPKFNIVRMFERARELLLEIAPSLVAAGRLDATDDIFMLSLSEVRAAISSSDMRAVAQSRRAEHTREIARRKLPRLLLSDGTEPEAPAAAVALDDAHLAGTPASAGTVTGRARVILDPIGAKLSPGEILVAPSTDPGWTPLFLTAGGLVMEMGGAMSHGAVVAREYGIPAVVGVTSATQRIKTGQVIQIDGGAGLIALTEEIPPQV